MSKAKAKKLIPPIFFSFPEDIGLRFLLKTQVGCWNPSDADLVYKAWGIEKNGVNTWRFVTNQYEAWASTLSNQAKIVRAHGVNVNYVYEYVPGNKKSAEKFVRKDVSFWDINRGNHFVSLDYGVDDLVNEVSARIKVNPRYYDLMSEKVEQLAKGVPIVGHTKPIAVDAHGYLQFV